MDLLMEKGLADQEIDESVERASLGGDDDFFPFMFSDATPDRMDDTIDAKGWDLSNYKRNPVILWAHDADQPPIGKSVSTFVKDDQLIGVVQFAETDFAQEVKSLYQGGFLNAVSVGFQPTDWEFGTRSDYGIDFKAQELHETSAVPVPAHPGALLEGRKRGLKRFVAELEKNIELFSEVELETELKKRKDAHEPEQMNISLDQIVREEFAKAAVHTEWAQNLAALTTSLTGKID